MRRTMKMSLTGESEKIQNLKTQIASLEKELLMRDHTNEQLKRMNDQLSAQNKRLKNKVVILKKAIRILNDTEEV